MEHKKSIQEILIEEFSSKEVQETYKKMTREGLWWSEEKLFRKYFKKGSKVLDIGCGSGRTTFPLAKMGYKVIGIDITPAMIKSAKELAKEFKAKIDFRVGDATRLEFKDESFDSALFSFNGWDQIPGKGNRLKALKEAFRIIKLGKYFIFTSHVRKFGKWTPFWIIQWIKMYILKPLGFSIKEIEFGDRFFKKATREKFEREQYIHILKLPEIKQQIKQAGFKLVFNEWRNTVAPKDKKMKSGNCMFFICKKPALQK